MAILPVTLDDVEAITTIVNPVRNYSSGASGVTGSLQLFPRASSIEKEVRPLTAFSSSLHNDADIEALREDLSTIAMNIVEMPNGNFLPAMESFLKKVNEQSASAKKQHKIFIRRFTPSTKFTSNTLRKLNVKDMLMSHYRVSYPTCNWAYTNYNCLNFFTSPTVPTSSVLMFPSIERTDIDIKEGHVSGTYALSGGFSFDFYVNPRYKEDGLDSGHFKAGTIFHLSSSYALSLVTGSLKDENGLPASFRLQLQLSHSADIPPSKAVPGSYPNDLIFLSDDNSLDYNKWQHVVVRWGTNAINDGTGSFLVDTFEKGNFAIPSGTITPRSYTTKSDPRILFVGNFYEGNNDLISGSQLHFFGDVPSSRDGTDQLIDNAGYYDQPVNYSFNHPLKAEVHDLTIRRYYLTDFELKSTHNRGISSIDPNKIAFYLPPFFVEQTPNRFFTNSSTGSIQAYGGVLQTPFFELDGSTDDPFNVAMAYGVNGHYINLENFVKDFANDVWPRLHHMTGTAITYTTDAREANEFLYADPFVRRRNLLVMPCDDGQFFPDYNLIDDKISNKQKDIFGRFNPSLISLENLLSTDSLLIGSTYDDEQNDLADELVGYTPENPGLEPGPAIRNAAVRTKAAIAVETGSLGAGVNRTTPLAIYQRTKDDSSNQVTFFDISNLFYGNRILPKSFTIKDSSLSGSGGRVSITIKDDGLGNLYRADSLSKHDTKNSIGNIFYDEGVVLIKSPHLYFFGKDQYEMSFKGEQNIHSLKYEVLAPPGLLNSSSNPSYAPLKESLRASGDPTDNDIFVYISNINFHDENLNVIAKATLAQPALKREGEKILFKVGFDF
jgi:hypothetical protein